MEKKPLNFFQSISFTMACMVGTGIFTSMGYQLESIRDFGWIFFLWWLGGMIAYAGALVYASLGTTYTQNGGEVLYLSRLLHPVFGYVNAWVSMTAGFAAPAAASALTAASFLVYYIPQVNTHLAASVVLVFLTVVHTRSIHASGNAQNVMTAFKVFFMLFFIVSAFCFGKGNNIWTSVFSRESFHPSVMGTSLLYVLYAYSGWNAFGYYAGHIKDARDRIPQIARVTVLMVFVLYLLMNISFILAAPVDRMAGSTDAAAVAADFLFGPGVGKIITSMLGILLISSTSAFIFTGPRIFLVHDTSLRFPSLLRKTNPEKIPVWGLWIQCVLSLCFVWLTDVGFILRYSGFSLSFFTLLSVAGSLKLKSCPGSYRVPFHPLPQIFFMLIHLVIYYFSFDSIRKEIMVFVGVFVFGSLLFYLVHLRRGLPGILLLLCVFSCSEPKDKENDFTPNLRKDSVHIVHSRKGEEEKNVVIEVDKKCKKDEEIDGYASVVSGIMEEISGKMATYPLLKRYCQRMEKKWMMLDSSRLEKVRIFAQREIRPHLAPGYTLFYPFSGADFLFADNFFQDAGRVVMCALELPGSLPDFTQFIKREDSLGEYLHRVENSLYALMRFSFFKTRNMREEFRSSDVNGVVHLMLFFIKRCGYNIEQMAYFKMDSAGVHDVSGLRSADGIRWKLCKGNVGKEVYYYRADISNSSWKKHENKLRILLGDSYVASFVKSASYLMHQRNFSFVRDFICTRSGFHVQDESGIPVKYFMNSSWELRLYGEYRGPIRLFSMFYQKDLDSLYKVMPVRKLGFGIGYNYKDNNSCFMIFKKK